MNPKKTSLTLSLAIFFMLAAAFTIGCSKNSNPQPPIHDTITVIKKDTLTDTLYATKPDPTVNLTKGLLVYLPFSGNIADSSGNGNPTTSTANVLTYDAHGYSNNAFGATGNGERVYVTNNGSIVLDTAFTLSFGFMVNDNRTETYISMVDPATGKGPTFIVGTTLPAYPNKFDIGIGDITTGCGNYGTIDNVNIADSTGFIPNPGSWYNAIVAYHKGSLQFYINGKLVSTKAVNGNKLLNCPNSQMIIGAWWNGDTQSFNGKLDNIRLHHP